MLHYDNQDDTKCALLTVYILEKNTGIMNITIDFKLY